VSGSRPETVLDPVCGMTVNVAHAEEAGLTVEHEGRTFAICRSGCRRAFEEEPTAFAARADAAVTAEALAPRSDLTVIDEGMRRWYESCSCCLSDAYPEIKAALDAERAAQMAPPVGAGICEVAEAHEVATT
jgi:YHS domain-containing protein